jgi:hypothetical protein
MVVHDLDRTEIPEERSCHLRPRDQEALIGVDDVAIFRRGNLPAAGNPVREPGPAFEFLSPAFTLEFVPPGGPGGEELVKRDFTGG